MMLESRSRIRLFSIFILCFALLLVGKLYMVQIVNADVYAGKANRQYVQSNYDYFDRGSIFFQNKDGGLVPAATLKSGFILAINPKLVLDVEGTFEKIQAIHPIDKDVFFAKAKKKTSSYEEIAKRFPIEKSDELTAEKLPGVSLYQQRWRFYPGNSMAAQTVGFVAYDDSGESLTGRYGLERYYQDTLKRNNDAVFVNFFAEIFSNINNALSSDTALEGDVVTTIEPSVQAMLEQVVVDAQKTWSSDETAGIVMDPMTGAIYAMATVPTFDLNDFQSEKSTGVYANHMVERVYEMGSIIKPITMAVALDTGAVTRQSVYNDTGQIRVNSRTISNYDGKARGVVSVQEILNQSLNVGSAWVQQRIGNDTFAKYMMDFGFGSETGIDLPNETHGLVNNLKSPRDVEYITASFGQGVAYTPIETVRALAALGNGGKLVNPHIASQINHKIGGSKKIDLGVEKQVLKPETSTEITQMLVNVVDKALRGGEVKMEHYSIAAKTGTAQISKGSGGGYYDDRYLHSFFGYFPAYNPRFIVFLYTVHPKEVKYASETLTDPFINMAKFLINYYQIPPDR